MDFVKTIRDRLQGKAPKGSRRSSQWRKVRKTHLKAHPTCAVCGGKKKVEVHHIVPYHFAPEHELNPKNLLSLCERKKYGINCHLLIGHLGNYRRVNTACEIDATMWAAKLKRE